MADLTGVTTNYIPTAHETFEDTLSASCLAGATTVFITNLGEYNDGDVVVLTVDPGTANEATFTGVKQSAPYRVTDVEWTEGNVAVGHNSGATVIDYDSATHYNMVTKLLKIILNQDGTLKTQPVRDALGLGATAANGWEALGYAPNTVVDNGNGSYTATVNGVDLTGTTTVGDKMLLPRAATATQCATFDGVNDYFSKATPNKMTWTDDFTVSVWVKPSQNATLQYFFSRYNGTSGFEFGTDVNGVVFIQGRNAGAANWSKVVSYRSVVNNRWQHISGLLDMSAFTAAAATAETAKSWIMFDGVEVLAQVLRNGTNPTALVQAGNWEVGAVNGGTSLYTGKMAQVAVYNTRVLQATIRASRNQPLTGSETNLATAHSFNNSIIDLNTTTPNDLTANGGVVATTADTPFTNPITGTNLTAGTRNYAIIHGQTFTGGNTVYTLQVAEGETIPTTTPPTSVSYSRSRSPYGFPTNAGKWRVYMAGKQGITTAAVAMATTTQFFRSLVMPIGAWKIGYEAIVQQSTGAVTSMEYEVGLSTNASAIQYDELSAMGYDQSAQFDAIYAKRETFVELTSATQYYLVGIWNQGSGTTTLQLNENRGLTIVYADNAYL